MPLSPSPSPPPDPSSAGGALNVHLAGEQTTSADGTSAQHAASAQKPLDPRETTRKELEKRVRKVIDRFYEIATRAADMPEGSEEALMGKILEAISSLSDLMAIAPSLTLEIPLDVLEYIDVGRNPDLHTLALVRRLANDNQQMLGQSMALGHYRDQLQAALAVNFPELAQYVAADAIPTSQFVGQPS
ncbi:hypothetical protein K437DRAFT_221483 [Tilletiaria anomala UBC 951]|uniref:Mediator of RNA polymerase II transcription subunit 10 n=1 Tax=Tilletiaria anomala (strain ATCC 24038 / CBS 436.72 / UBC 951) TaxID=1037660 RepID=A0A066WL99_TILAU|nr:uncharacterized protein K437DRAFT_221483 [Tilletiaria anomala UBC 951]KDN51395.1 hypothetical protein K437DRAFT_221483 [Tilletiaria anomala UBC 951]